jgi:hypothetical protein
MAKVPSIVDLPEPLGRSIRATLHDPGGALVDLVIVM